MAKVITPTEFQSEDTIALARSLLGKALVRTTDRGRLAYLITEVEAYDGESDLACHASKGRTKELKLCTNQVEFGTFTFVTGFTKW